MASIEAIKAAGLAVDLYRYTKEGYRAVAPDDHYRLKTLGICGQKGEGHFMLRIKVPGGLTSGAQLDVLGDLAERFAGGVAHLTTRQGVELHSVRIEEVPEIFAGLASVGLTTKASCGDTIRNVVGCAQAGACIHELLDARPWIRSVAEYFLAIEPEQLNVPRKMNVYVSGCPECSGHAQINDIALVATQGADGRLGFALWAGGGLGANPRLAHLLAAFVPFEEALAACRAIVDVYMVHGDRSSRARAKLKFLIDAWGIERFRDAWREALEARLAEGEGGLPSQVAAEPASLGVPALESWGEDSALPDGVARQRQPDRYRVAVYVPLGELTAEQLRGVAGLSRAYGSGDAVITREQNLELRDVPSASLPDLIAALRVLGLSTEGGSIRDVQSCPGTAFCPLAVTPAQEAAARLAALPVVREAGLRPLRIHISGCPHSCAQHQIADIGLCGVRAPLDDGLESEIAYQLYLGGVREGTPRLGALAHFTIPDGRLGDAIDLVLRRYLAERAGEETFTTWVDRVGADAIAGELEEAGLARVG
jgi:sulfite reductase beta subunit-like hemoprotein